MNTATRVSSTLVGIVITCVLSAGAAAAHPQPLAPNGAPIPVASQVAPVQPRDGAKSQALLRQQAYAEHMQRVFAEREAAAVAARRQAEVGQGTTAQSGSGTTSRDSGNATTAQSGSGTTSQGNGTDVPVLAVTALAGLALGAAGSSASRRLRQRPAFPK